MKTKVFFPAALIVALMIAQTCVAQEEVRYIKTGKMFLQGNIGYGGGAFIAVGASFPLVPQVNFEYILADEAFGEKSGSVGLGGVGALGLYSVEGSSVTAFVIGAQGNYHFVPKARFDPYVGLMLGFYTYSYTVGRFNFSYSGLGWSAHAGANYSVIALVCMVASAMEWQSLV